MPREVERKLLATARRRRYSKARTGAYVYGTLRRIERHASGGGGEGSKVARKGFLASFFHGRRGNKYRTSRGYGEAGSEERFPFHRRKLTRAAALKRRASEGRYERHVYDRRDVRGGWGLGRRKVRKAPMTVEEKRAAARRRYHEKHPGAKYRSKGAPRGRAQRRGFL